MNFPGLIENIMEFPEVIKKKPCGFPWVLVLGLHIVLRGVTQFFGVSRGVKSCFV